jgi:type IV secretion system protein VirB10
MSSLDLKPHGPRLRRLNRLPIFLGIGVAAVVVIVIVYTISQRGMLYGGTRAEVANGSSASSFAEKLKQSGSDGIVPAPEQPSPVAAVAQPVARPPETPVVVQQQADPAPTENHDDDWRKRVKREQDEALLREEGRQKMARVQNFYGAIDSPIAVDVGKLNGKQNATDPRAATAPQGQMGSGIPGYPTLNNGLSGTPGVSAGLPPTLNGRSLNDLYAASLNGGTANMDPNGQRGKINFLNDQTQRPAYAAATAVAPISPYEVKRGTIIPGALITAINSDLPGRITGQVSANVYDTVTGHHLLIPAGTRLLGRYDSQVVFGQERVLIAWTDIILPNGVSLQIGSMGGVDVEGVSGLADQVDNHYLKIYGSALVTAMIGAGIGMADARNSRQNTGYGYDASYAAQQSFLETFGRVVDRTMQKNLDIQPTIEIRAGMRFAILVDQDLVFPGPYAPAGTATERIVVK